MNVLFVCSGNTCRSAMAEIVLKQFLKQNNMTNVCVESCGLQATNGVKISSYAKITLEQSGYKVEKFYSKAYSFELRSQSDLIITMQESQKKIINHKNCISAKDVIGEEITDPYGKSVTFYNNTLTQIIKLCNAIINKITEESK